MRQRTKLTEKQLSDICSLREEGWSYQRIANRLRTRHGVSVSKENVAWQCLKLGADTVPRRRRNLPFSGPMRRNGHLVRPFTPEEDRILLEMREAGETLSAIGRRLGRRHNSLSGRLYTLARMQARADESAESGCRTATVDNPCSALGDRTAAGA